MNSNSFKGKKIYLISGDYGTYNPFEIIKNRLQCFGIQISHINRNDYKNPKDAISLIDDSNSLAIIGTSSDSFFEKLIFDECVKKNLEIYIFIDEIYNIKARLDFIKKDIKYVKNFFCSSSSVLKKYFPQVSIQECINPSYDLKHLASRFNYSYSKDGPLVIIDEYKDKFFLRKPFDEQNLHNMLFSEVIFKQLKFDRDSSLKIRSHPSYVKEDNYIEGEVSGFIGYSSMALSELYFMGFESISLASSKVVSTSTSLFSLNNINLPNTKNKNLKNIFDSTSQVKQLSASYLKKSDIIDIILDLL